MARVPAIAVPDPSRRNLLVLGAGLGLAALGARPSRAAVDPADVDDERTAGYYMRDLKSVVVRIPQAFGGRGYYIQGDHLKTIPAFYQHLVQGLAGPSE